MPTARSLRPAPSIDTDSEDGVAYMVYQQYTTAVLDAYAGRSDVAENLEAARACRQWLQSLRIDPKIREGWKKN